MAMLRPRASKAKTRLRHRWGSEFTRLPCIDSIYGLIQHSIEDSIRQLRGVADTKAHRIRGVVVKNSH